MAGGIPAPMIETEGLEALPSRESLKAVIVQLGPIREKLLELIEVRQGRGGFVVEPRSLRTDVSPLQGVERADDCIVFDGDDGLRAGIYFGHRPVFLGLELHPF